MKFYIGLERNFSLTNTRKYGRKEEGKAIISVPTGHDKCQAPILC